MNATAKPFTPISRVLLIITGICLTVSIFVPLWRIDLDAPQYPEGLRLFIFSHKLGGNVDIINGLNHYIGMKTLHEEEFIEFTILPYIIGFFALFSIITAIAGKRKILYVLLSAFILFGIVAMYDFWRWEYDYGHNLDPHAAIIVPGMAYQPPLIGFKQLLNFGAYSIPALGGWLFVASGVLMILCILIERRVFTRSKKTVIASMAATFIVLMTSCGDKKPEAIKLNSDNCDYCKMTISDARFAAELITTKGRVYKFDDIACLQNYKKENEKVQYSRTYVSDYCNPALLIEAETAKFVHGEKVNSPMGGNIAAYSNEDSAELYSDKLNGSVVTWNSFFK